MLTRKKKLFRELYIKTKNGSEAARQAGYSAKNVNRCASRLLSDVDIKPYIERRFKEIEKEFLVTQENWLEKTYKNFKEAKKESVQAHYWEMILKGIGALKEQPTQAITIFQDIESKAKEVLRQRELKESEGT